MDAITGRLNAQNPASPVFNPASPKDRNLHSALCVRQLDSDIAVVARSILPFGPIPDLPTLNALVPYRSAYHAFEAQNYQQSLSNLQAALSIQPNFVRAQWATGLVYGAMQQWDQAIAAFQAALSLDKNAGYVSDALAWAKEEKAQAEDPRKTVKASAPVWPEID